MVTLRGFRSAPRRFLALLVCAIALAGTTTGVSAAGSAPKCKNSGALTYSKSVESWYLSAYVPRPEDEAMETTYGYGTSWYSTLWPLFSQPVAGAQAGLASTWINPNSYLTHKVDSFPQPIQSAFIQTIEGSLGWWGDTAYRDRMPKYEPGVTINDYASGARDFWAGQPIPEGAGGWITISNQILLPPEGMTFTESSTGKQLGQMWLSLPFPKTGSQLPVKAGINAWTLFLNADNFSGPLAYVEPNYWALSVAKYPALAGLTFDNQMGTSYVLSGEFAGVPLCEQKDAGGTTFSKIPEMGFPTDAQGRFIFARDYRAYSAGAIARQLTAAINANAGLPSALDTAGVQVRHLQSEPSDVFQGGDAVPSLKGRLKLEAFDGGAAIGFDLASTTGTLPTYFVKKGAVREPVSAAEVPASLRAIDFAPKAADRIRVYQTLPWFNAAGKPASPVITTKLNDGSVVSYRWYKFVDQPQLARYKWTASEKAEMQALVVRMQKEWQGNSLQSPPSGGALASFDPGLLVKAPAGLEYGYVPVIIRQASASAKITCVKGKSVKVVVGAKPRCPAGYVKRS